ISFLRISWKAPKDLVLFHGAFHQHPAVARDVLENEVSWKRHESAGAARESDRTESGCASLELAVPELVTSRRPVDLQRRSADLSSLALQIHDGQHCRTVRTADPAPDVDKGNQVSSR